MTIEENLSKTSKNDKFLFISYDQEMETDKSVFNLKNINPDNIFKVSDNGYFGALVVPKGLAEKYYVAGNHQTLLIVTLNSQHSLYQGEPLSKQLCSVSEAVKLGAVGISYTVYLGSEHESEMLQEFGRIEEEAHTAGLVVICSVYPKGKAIKDPFDNDVTAYGARIGLELGADIINLHYSNQPDKFHWVIQSAGKAKVLVSGTKYQGDEEVVQQAREVMLAGASGMIVGREVLGSEDPNAVSKRLHEVVMEGKML